MVNPPLTIWMADCPSQASGGMAPRAPSGSMTMATRSGPAAGDLSLSEIREFAGFPAATQRYIRRSLDIGLERDDAIARWSRDMVEETAIRSEEHTSELQSLMRNSYAVFCLKKKTQTYNTKKQKLKIQNKHKYQHNKKSPHK